MCGYMRTGLSDFPAFGRFHTEIDMEMQLFVRFLSELEKMELSAEALDRIMPLMPDPMMREEWYSLSKLAAAGLAPAPNGDPAKPRVKGEWRRKRRQAGKRGIRCLGRLRCALEWFRHDARRWTW